MINLYIKRNCNLHESRPLEFFDSYLKEKLVIYIHCAVKKSGGDYYTKDLNYSEFDSRMNYLDRYLHFRGLNFRVRVETVESGWYWKVKCIT